VDIEDVYVASILIISLIFEKITSLNAVSYEDILRSEVWSSHLTPPTVFLNNLENVHISRISFLSPILKFSLMF
jgi:hypothetical protein